jgi:hypothetical protein
MKFYRDVRGLPIGKKIFFAVNSLAPSPQLAGGSDAGRVADALGHRTVSAPPNAFSNSILPVFNGMDSSAPAVSSTPSHPSPVAWGRPSRLRKSRMTPGCEFSSAALPFQALRPILLFSPNC